MPLRDHFRSPVNDTHSWDEVHGGWPMEIVRTLRSILPAGFRAGPNIHLGSPFEVDVSTYDLDSPIRTPSSAAVESHVRCPRFRRAFGESDSLGLGT